MAGAGRVCGVYPISAFNTGIFLFLPVYFTGLHVTIMWNITPRMEGGGRQLLVFS